MARTGPATAFEEMVKPRAFCSMPPWGKLSVESKSSIVTWTSGSMTLVAFSIRVSVEGSHRARANTVEGDVDSSISCLSPLKLGRWQTTLSPTRICILAMKRSFILSDEDEVSLPIGKLNAGESVKDPTSCQLLIGSVSTGPSLQSMHEIVKLE